MTEEVLDGFSGSPMIGAFEEIGDPGGNAISFLDVDVEDEEEDRLGELYMNVAARTIDEPSKKANVIGYENRATDARNDIIIDKEVANPFLFRHQS